MDRRDPLRAQRTSLILAVIGWAFIIIAVVAMFYVGIAT